ncbi:unnamed protein product [Coffea canephora]|uniref:Protein kinase domain-containing protein n=1 Tax=Coffea canephora TaxID=49390 RepID=A0A068UVV9_COFCA|nr:unnamed protein product [Coffea canephora]
MGKEVGHAALVLFFALSVLVGHSQKLQSSQAQTLLRIQQFLNFPESLSGWKNDTDFCNPEPRSTLTVVCYEESITQLHIIGEKETNKLSKNFSIDSFVTTLVKLPNLKVLRLVSLGLWGALPDKLSRLSSLEILDISSNFFYGTIPRGILSLTGLQALIFDGNMFNGRFPDELGSLSVLTVLSMRNNSCSGSLPDSLGSLENLRILALSNNNFSGEVPDLRNLENLQVLDLENNSLGPQFPPVNKKIVSLVLRKNKFTYGIPDEVKSFYQLDHLDVSSNKFVGPFPSYLLSMPSITYLDISANRFTGMLFEDVSCNTELKFVNLSANLLTGRVPSCLLSNSRNRIFQYAANCLATKDVTQQPNSYCQNQALAVGILPHHRRQKEASKIILALSISGSTIGAVLLLALAFVLVRKFLAKNEAQKLPVRIIEENASTGYTSKILSDARYITQAMKLGAIGLPAYRTFSLEELEEATNNFDTSSFIGEGSCGQMYRGQMKDGTYVAIRCLKMKRRHSTQDFLHHIELISKLRHQHLVSALGHCFECYLDDSSVSRIFLVFEYVPNGTLRSWISDRRARSKLNWTQRIAAAIGVAKGIQFLHTGIVPGIFPNYLKITDVLLDQNLVAKVSSYNLPLLAEHMGKDDVHSSNTSTQLKNLRVMHQEKFDIYDFGIILLEIISGRLIISEREVVVLKDQLQAVITADDASRKRVVDPAVSDACSDQSLKTMIEICCKCLLQNPADRPSVEDILWNLQFAAQVQDGWRGESFHSSDGSPVSSFKPPHQRLTIPWH